MRREYWIRHWESLVLLPSDAFFQKIEKWFLVFASFFYGCAIQWRNKSYDLGFVTGRRVGSRVISIGNLSLGGTGKTSLALWCIEKLVQKNKKPAVLSRGYLRKSLAEEVKILSEVNRNLENAFSVGDEPYLISSRYPQVPVVVGADRVQTAEIASKTFEPDCLLLDDGFQHRRLYRDLDIVCLDETLFKAPYLFPRGVLREKVESLKRANFIVIKTERSGEVYLNLFRETFSFLIDQPFAVFSYRIAQLMENHTGKILPLEWLAGQRVCALSGICDPEGFENLLIKHQAKVKLSKRFADHHPYAPEELSRILEESKENGCRVLTTEKDSVKMDRNFPAVVVCVKVAWVSGENELEESIWKVIGNN